MRVLNWLKAPANALLAMILAAMVAIIVFTATTKVAKAADLGGPKADPLAVIVPKKAPFSGCGPSLRAGWIIGTLDVPAPVTAASEGGALGIGLGCDWQAAKYFLLGAFVTWDKPFNDLKTLGVNSDLSAGVRVGLPVKNWMPYVGAAWSRVNVGNGIGDVDGWKALAGLEVRLATEAPLFLAVEGSRAFYSNVAGSGMDVDASSLIASVKFKFGGK
jgi:hypothetical protein